VLCDTTNRRALDATAADQRQLNGEFAGAAGLQRIHALAGGNPKMESSTPSVSALQKAQDITSRWADGDLGADEAQHALKSVFDHWQPGVAMTEIEQVAESSLTAARIAFQDWQQRGENCEELVTQLRWILDPSKDGISDPALNVYAPQRPD
jgi:hypothetical protein